MHAISQHILRHRLLGGLIIALALMMKLAIPTGYMVASDHGRLAIVLCSGFGPATLAPPAHSMAGHHDKKQEEHGKPEMPCAFAGLGAHALSAADPILLATAIRFILAAAFQAAPGVALARPPFLRPPPRGPPLPF
ncbi:MAG: hypothetical protein JWM75_991 [Sphingomonas bacterium]|nr:hypothetical protein [Sphingomonas bacterium]